MGFPNEIRREVRTVTIINGASVSDIADLGAATLLGFIAPGAWTAAALNIETSVDGTAWNVSGLLDSAAAAISSWAAVVPSTGYSVNAANMRPWRYIRFRSGTSAAATNQLANRVFTIITGPTS